MSNLRGPTPEPQLSGFKDLRRDDDGFWRATHISSGREAAGETWVQIELSALVIRISEALNRTRW